MCNNVILFFVILYLVAPVFGDSAFCSFAIRDYKYACDDPFVLARCGTVCKNNQVRCYDCPSVDRPETCQNTTLCARSQKCLLTGFIDNHFKKKYRMSCASTTDCNSFVGTRSKKSQLLLSGYCCYHDNCNKQLTEPVIPALPDCQDFSVDGCKFLQQHKSTFCTHHHHLDVKYCPVTCGRCNNITTTPHVTTTTIDKIPTTPQITTISQTADPITTQQVITTTPRITSTSQTSEEMTTTPRVTTILQTDPTTTVLQTTTTSETPSSQITTAPKTTDGKTTTQRVTTISQSTIPITTILQTTTTTETPTTQTTTRIPTTLPTTPTTITYPQLSCEVDFIQVGGSCYYFNPEGRTEKWEDAKVICMALGSNLVIFETNIEEYEMKNYLLSQHGNDRHYSYWTGGIKSKQSGDWVWDATGSSIMSTSWYSGQEVAAPGHDCLEYGPMFDYKWNNGNCDLSSNFICEKN